MNIIKRLKNSSFELREDDAGGDRHVEGFGAFAGGEARDGEAPVCQRLDFGRDAFPFVAHDDDAGGGKGGGVDVFPVEERPEYGYACRTQAGDGSGKVYVERANPEDGAHACLYALGVVGTGAVPVAKDVAHAKPIRKAEDGAQVAGILDAIEREGEALGEVFPGIVAGRDFSEGNGFG